MSWEVELALFEIKRCEDWRDNEARLTRLFNEYGVDMFTWFFLLGG